MKISNRELRQRLLSERQSILNILESISASDKLNRLNFEEELASLNHQLSRLKDEDSRANRALSHQADEHEYTSLIFYGDPVIAQRGIDASFAADVLVNFQRVVSSLVAARQGITKNKGPVPLRGSTNLHITNIVRGSFGFVIEPIARQSDLFENETAHALGLATRLISKLSEPGSDEQDNLISETNERTLQNVQRFFQTMKKSNAQMRMETKDGDYDIYESQVITILENVSRLEVEETIVNKRGTLEGLLPEGHRFELKVDGETVSGSVSKSLSYDQLVEWLSEHHRQPVHVSLKRREVFRNNKSIRISFSLQGID